MGANTGGETRHKWVNNLRKLPMPHLDVGGSARSLILKGYRYALDMPFAPSRALNRVPRYPWMPKEALGKDIRSGIFSFDHVPENYDETFWHRIDKRDPTWLREFYSFGWCHDVRAYREDATSAAFIRQVISDWYANHRQRTVSQHSDIAAERLVNWLYHDSFLLNDADRVFSKYFRKTQFDTVTMLDRVRARKAEKTSLPVLKGLVFAALYLPGADYLLRGALSSLQDAIRSRFLADGGHYTRSPEGHMVALQHIFEIAAVLRGSDIEPDNEFYALVQQSLNALMTLTHPDGKLALFNDSVEKPIAPLLELWSKWGQTSPKAVENLPDSGFIRLEQGGSMMLMDAAEPRLSLSRTFQGTMSFEFSGGDERIFVNCGAYRGASLEWKEVCRQTAAHSTLVLGDRNATPSVIDDFASVADLEVSREQEERDGELVAETAYNGYVSQTGLVHYRRIALKEHGSKLQGIDVLAAQSRDISPEGFNVKIRFHLHPSVEIVRISRGTIELKTPSGKEWSFVTAQEYAASVEESVYLGEEGRPQKTLQLCIASTVSSAKGLQLKWQLERKTA